MTIDARTLLCATIGKPNRGSRAPVMHNAGFAALGIPYAYLAFEPEADALADVLSGMRALQIRGFSVTKPYKQAVLPLLDHLDPPAAEIGAVNTILNDDGRLVGYNSDWIGAVEAVKEALADQSLKDSGVINDRPAPTLSGPVFVLGAGGAAKAVAYGFRVQGAQVRVFNRTVERAEELAAALNVECGGSLQDVQAAAESAPGAILVNATSAGMAGTAEADVQPVAEDALSRIAVVLDAVIVPRRTPLLEAAARTGCTTIEGVRMLFHQGMFQFKLFTGHEAPRDVMWEALLRS